MLLKMQPDCPERPIFQPDLTAFYRTRRPLQRPENLPGEPVAFHKRAQDHFLDFVVSKLRTASINTGPVVAGVVGTKRFAYDILGDAVNIASHMESNSEPGRINISENTYQLAKEDFDSEYRGAIEAENRGHLNMYFVKA